MRKYVLLTIAVLAVIAGILGFFFSSPKYQIINRNSGRPDYSRDIHSVTPLLI